MSCLCYKLLTRQYHTINDTENEILKRTWAEAPHLFQAYPRTPPDIECPVAQAKRKRAAVDAAPLPQKHPRSLSDSSSKSLIPSQPRDQPLQIILPLSPSAVDLVKTYSYEKAVNVFGESGLDIQQANGGVFVKLLLAIERSDQKIEIQQLFRRTCCYAFAQLHKKGTSVDPIVQEIENALPLAKGTKTRVYNILRAGTKWIAIVEQFASIVNRAPQQLTGLLCLLGSASAWEKAATKDHRSALANLHENTNIYEGTLRFTLFVSKVLNQIHLERSFIDESRTLTSQSNTILTTSVCQSSRSSLKASAALLCRNLDPVIKVQPAWKAPSITAVSKAVPGSSGMHSEDANILLVVLSFFSTSEKIPLDLLYRGATPRKRWSVQGEIEEVDANRAGVAPELGSLLSDISRLAKAFQELEESSSVVSDSTKAYTLNEAVASCVRENLSAEHLSFWRCQALIITYRAIPWKYLESAIPNPRLFLPHLKKALEAFQDCFKDLPASTRADLALTLIEASRFPTMVWKRFAIGQAEVAARDLKDPYLHSCIAQSQSLLGRIAGNMGRAVSSLGDLRLSSTVDKRMHSAIGQATIQHSLNCVQVEDISGAKRSLENWSPLNQPSPMEEVVLFRKDTMLGRLSRFQGEFADSLAHLEKSRKTAEELRNLIFEEDLRDLTCDLADTLRELDDPASAERHLQAEITRRDQSCICSPGQSLLELSLAEALFAQERFKEAERLCLDVQSRPSLLKFEKLRLHITMAKIRHVKSDYEGALSCWSGAMEAIGKFHMTNGRSTRIIVLSICDTLRHLGQTWLADASLKEAASLDELAKPGGTQYWIAGMRHWLEYLRHQGRRSRM